MARAAGIQVENNFTRGLITENTALNFPENACTETFNCVFDETGRVTRRNGIDVEQGYTVGIERNRTAAQAYTEYLWSNVAGTGVRSFLVQQQGSNLVFYDVSNDSGVTKNNQFALINLNTFETPNSPFNVSQFPCQYAQGDGRLIVVSANIEPLVIAFNTISQLLEVETVNIQYRDFLGLPYTETDYYDINYRPPFASIAAMKADVPDGTAHYYNLLNQGWWQGRADLDPIDSALSQWDTARADMPGNGDRVSFYRASETDSFDNARVVAYGQGNTPAIKGHFILSVGNPDRRAALESEGYTISYNSSTDQTVSYSDGTFISGVAVSTTGSSLSAAFDGSASYIGSLIGSTDNDLVTGTGVTASVSSTAEGYVGKNYSGGKAIAAVDVVINPEYIATTSTGAAITSFGSSRTFNYSGTIQLYGKNGAPSNPTDGTVLGSTNFSTGNPTTYTITSSDAFTTYTHVWVRIVAQADCSVSGLIGTNIGITLWRSQVFIGEVSFTERITTVAGEGALPDPDVTYVRPRCTAFYAGRAWYGGLDAQNVSNNVYFSQVIERPEQYGQCYQLNDPTSEEFFDVLPTDGGIIKIPEMGRLVRMMNFQSSLLLFATNGVWLIRGSNAAFTASNFLVRKISSFGTQSPYSFVEVNGIPVWWGEDGILQIEYNPQFDSFSVKNISEETIRTFFFSIPPSKRALVKGAYDVNDGVIYWIYNDDMAVADCYCYNKALCLNTLSNAYYPWTFTNATPEIRGIIYVTDSIGFTDPVIKFPVTLSVTTSSERMTFADQTSGRFVDWFVASTVTGDTVTNYLSYFITGYKIHAEAIKFFQANYVMIFMEQEDNSGAFMQGIFDFTNSGSSGKWGSSQQLYNSSRLHRDVITRRLKVRGKGKAMQFKIRSQDDRPFTIIGWAAMETSNTLV